MEKCFAKIKHLCSDFIVEEVADNWECRVDSKPQKIEIPEKPKDRDFLWFEMQKEDIDHFVAIKTLAKQFGKNLKFISYAGSKDKKAITSQRICVYLPNIETIKKFKSSFIKIKNFKWEKRKLHLGDLIGNNFRVILRDIDKKSAIKTANSIRQKKEFINYFGSQRFGSVRKNNFEIGVLILKRKFREAIIKILTEDSPDEKEDVREARKRLRREGDFKKALEYFPKNLRLELKILKSLVRRLDFKKALKSIDKRYTLMLVQAVQSKIFNEVLKRAQGKVDFSREENKKSVLVGYRTRFSKGPLGEIERKVLDDFGIKKEDFDIREIPHLRLKGSIRQTTIKPKNLNVLIEDDEIFQPSKKIILEFFLPSGTYATTFLENFFTFE